MAKKPTTATVTPTPVPAPSQENERKTLSQLAFFILTILVNAMKVRIGKATAEESPVYKASLPLLAEIPKEVFAELEGMKMVENKEGEYVPTGFGTKTVLEAGNLGYNFKTLVKGLSFNAFYSLLFVVLDELKERTKEEIMPVTKTGQPNRVWQGLDALDEWFASWLAPAPETNETPIIAEDMVMNDPETAPEPDSSDVQQN